MGNDVMGALRGMQPTEAQFAMRPDAGINAAAMGADPGQMGPGTIPQNSPFPVNGMDRQSDLAMMSRPAQPAQGGGGMQQKIAQALASMSRGNVSQKRPMGY